MKNCDTIHVCLAFNDKNGTYARHAAVTITSIFKNTTSNTCIHILHDHTLTEKNRMCLNKITESNNQSLMFHDVSGIKQKYGLDLKKLGKRTQLSEGSLFRLLIPIILKHRRAIYLDCDIIVNRDIRDLWEVDLRGKAVGVVQDVWSLDNAEGKKLPWRLGKVWDLLGIEHDAYFNSGVILMDLDKIRTSYNLIEQIEIFFNEYGSCVTMEDQDFLNWIFSKDKLILDEPFNHIRYDEVSPQDLKGSIWHMASGTAKPWTIYTRPYVDDLYWHYLRETPYCNSEEELITILLTDMSHSPCMHRHSKSCIKKTLVQLKQNLFCGHVLKIPAILWKLYIMRKKEVYGS